MDGEMMVEVGTLPAHQIMQAVVGGAHLLWEEMLPLHLLPVVVEVGLPIIL